MPTTRYTTLISAANLAARIASKPDSTILFDCRFDLANDHAGQAAYDTHHLPAAHYLHLAHVLSGPCTGQNGRHPLPDRATLVRHLAACGLDNKHQVIAYDAQGGVFAARLWWLLRWLGHEAVAVLDGGMQAWQKAGFPLSNTPSIKKAGNFKSTAPLTTTVDVAVVMRNIHTQEYKLIDARSADRYRGENETLDPIGGHIPGAIQRSFKDNLTAEGHMKPASVLRDEFSALLGEKTAQQAILQCGSGVSACLHALAMDIAGLHGAALYPGSWSEWCADPTRPITTGPNSR